MEHHRRFIRILEEDLAEDIQDHSKCDEDDQASRNEDEQRLRCDQPLNRVQKSC